MYQLLPVRAIICLAMMIFLSHYLSAVITAIRVKIQMKLFQQLLVAPAALGLMAPMAANADRKSVV